MENDAHSESVGDVIFIAPSFFGYSHKIERKIRELGFNVFQYEDRPSTSTLSKILIRLFPTLAGELSVSYFKNIFDRHAGAEINYLIVIKGEALSSQSVKLFKKLYPRAQTVLYLWDSLSNARVARDSLPEYDSVFTFDIQDYEVVPGLKFMPLFFSPVARDYRWSSICNKKDIDLSFIGTAHTDRVAIIQKIRSQVSAGTIMDVFLYMPSKFVYLVRRFFDPSFWKLHKSAVSFVPLKHDAVEEIVARSKAVLDIERRNQSGLTIRTLEALSKGVKIVTTNVQINRYSFYHPSNILVVDRKNPVIPREFLDSPFVPLEVGQIEKYDINNWVRTLLGFQAMESYLDSE